MNIIYPTNSLKLYGESSINIFQDTLSKVYQLYKDYYHFDRIFVCVDEKTLQVFDYDYEEDVC